MKQLLLLAICIPLFSTAQVLTVDQTQLNFGTVNEITPDSLQLTITNTSATPITVNQIKFYNTYNTTPFSVNESNFTIAANGNKTVWVKFSPQHNIMHNSEMIIKHTANSGYTRVDLMGQGTYSKTYYSSTENTSEEALKTALNTRLGQGYISLGYNSARDAMFMTIDNEKTNGQNATVNTLECVYTGTKITGYSSRSAAQNGSPQFNTEHTYPQSTFSSAEPMKSDLFHLFPTTNTSNSNRGNNPFGVVSNGTATGGGSFYNSSMFEPRDAQKGTTARALMYFVLRYQNYGNHFTSQENILKQWHATFAPDAIEQRRNDDIFAVQGNRNPFIDYPQFADRITNFVTTSSAPTIKSIDITQPTISFGTVNSDTLFNYIIVNTGNTALNLTNITLSNTTDLSFSPAIGASATLNVGEAFVFPIKLSANTFGTLSETLSFNTGLPGSQGSISVPITANVVTSLGEITWEQSISIFPNPVNNQLNINSSYSGKLDVKLYNLLGQPTAVDQINSNGNIQINTTELPEGVYLLELTNGNERILKKIMK
ncbi:endonuclease [Acidiluteibacter ferrifornacis]|uniref:T9SS type A sorting domain-containing protein n=1 Tax=Acidiluteibacter ferrifornacis TaxID=2692424 RepID=A0A6N9NH77_9FLAO|nr:endonuclease [Acidiluteibacter ferrifornacis]NBG65263.1 T9SS type A sorting domain-containing protein [Acidiluteibacter ferrifornacis]